MMRSDILENEILMLIEEHNKENIFGCYPNIYHKDFSLAKLPLNEVEIDIFMECFFTTFNVEPGNYCELTHFPQNRSLLNRVKYFFRKKQGKVIPVTVRFLHNAVVKGRWPAI